jgi:hypothetical protein
MADFTHYQDVVLLRDIPEEGLCAGDVGTIVERHDVPGREPGYSVEFFDMLGNTVAVVTLPTSALRAPTRVDRPAVRVAAGVDKRPIIHVHTSLTEFLPSYLPSSVYHVHPRPAVHVEIVLIFLYLISAPVLITVFTALRGPADVLLFFVNYPPSSFPSLSASLFSQVT